METNGVVITNNPMVSEKYAGVLNVVFSADYTYLNVLELVRDKIHLGHRLLTHPLSGSVKPGETPYKTVIVSKEAGALDLDSLEIIEQSLQTAVKFISQKPARFWSERVKEDFQLIDLSLIFGITSN